jgi:predicted ATPase/DNA-binding SARP family transcriptional activator
LEFRILGPLEALSDGQALDLGGAKQRALLAVLLLNANAVVSHDRMIDALWEDDPPESAHKSLQVHVSSLRKLVGRDRVETKPAGYVLQVREHELDLDRFRELWQQGRLRDALSLWRGPALADFGYRRFAQAEIAHLEELRLACLEERIEQDLQVGRHAELTGELEALVQANPLRERLRAQLMLALYRTGRQAEALEAYQAARATLVDQLGIEPGRPLRDLHQQILNQDSSLDLPEKTAEGPEHTEPRETSAPAPDPGPLPRETRKTVTVLCASVTAATADGRQLDPEALRRVVGGGFAQIRAAVERHGGSVEAATGGMVIAIFGIPALHEDDAQRALRAAAEASDSMEHLARELHAQHVTMELRVGISTGEVVVGGSLQPAGEPLASARDLTQLAVPGQILLDGATHRFVRNAAHVRPLGEAFELLDVGSEPTGLPPRRSPMVGRDRERRRLQHAFEQAVDDRSSQLFTVLGPAGVGKSRLVQEFLGALGSQALVAGGRCLPYGEGITYWPLLEAVKAAVGLEDTDTPDEAKRKLATALGDERPAESVAQRIAELTGLVEATPGVEEEFAAVQALFEALARTRPLVLLFDDIHWGESTFLDLLEYLADWTREVPMLLLCLARPELLDARPGWAGGKLNATSILLEPLSEAESAELIRNLAGIELDEAAKGRIVEAAEGNPLFVEEMLALAQEDGLREGELVVPPTIHSLLAARLDRLGEEDRTVIDRAAVQGKVFYEDALAAMAVSASSAQVAGSLASLVHKELIRPERTGFGGRTYRFRHILIRDAAYESVPKEIRANLHERFARWLERASGDRSTEYEEIVGYHLEQAYRYRSELGEAGETVQGVAREAAERLGAAARRAFVRSDAPAAVNLTSRAVALLKADDPLRVDLVPNVRVVQGMVTSMEWADHVLTEAVEAAATTGDRRLAAHALVQRGLLRLFTEVDGTADEFFDVARRAIAVFEELGDEPGLARAWRLTAQAYYLDRRLSACAEASERALVHARRAGDPFEERETMEWLVIALFLGPLPAAEAAERCRSLLAQNDRDQFLAIQLLGGLAFLTAIQGDLDEARALLMKARRLMDDAGEWVWILSWHVAFVSLLEADPVAAEREIRPSYEALKRIGEKSHFSTMAHALALAVYEQGRYEEAESLASECAAAARANDVNSRITSGGVRAKVLARRGELAEAEASARDAVSLAADSDLLTAHGDALVDLAEVLALAGRHGEAAGAVREAIQLYEQKGNGLAVSRARAVLARLEDEGDQRIARPRDPARGRSRA